MTQARQHRAPEQLTTPAEHFDLLHHEHHGTALVWELGGLGKRWHKLAPGDASIPALLAAQAGQTDRFLSVNEFNGWRTVRLLNSLRACYVDIDGCTDYVYALEALRDALMPPPSVIVQSGRGLHFYWLIQQVPAQALPVWQRVQDALLSALKPIGGDPAARDCARVLRIVGSINSKNNQPVIGRVFDPVPWTFHDLCDEVLGERVKPKRAQIRDMSAARAERGERTNHGSIYDRWHRVYRDLLAIALAHPRGIPEGHRNNWLYLSAVALSWFAQPDTLHDELERQAKVWTPSLSPSEISAALKAPLERAEQAAEGHKLLWRGNEVDPRYHYKRQTLYDMLKPIISDELEASGELRSIISDETRAKHEREREVKRDRVEEGRRLSHNVGRRTNAASAAQAKPWDALGLSRATYYRKKAAGSL